MKKNIALLSIWILIFATYGPVANVSADDPLGKCGAELCGKWWLFETCAPDEMCVEKLGTYGCEEKVECLDSDKRISDIGASENHIRCFDPVRGVIPESEKTEQSVCVACTFEEPPETIKCCRFGIMNPQYFWSTEDCPITVVLDPCWETDNKECAAKSWNDYPGGVECRVINFNLPQKDKAAMSTVAKAKEWISGMGDPDYVLYYEAFPEGEEAAWRIPGNEMFVAYLLIEGVCSMIPVVGKSIGGKAAESVMARVVANRAGQKLLLATEKVGSRKLLSWALNSHHGDETAAELIEQFMKKGPTTAQETLEESFEKIAIANGKTAADGAAAVGTWGAKTGMRGVARETIEGGIKRAKIIPQNIKTKIIKSKWDTAKEAWENPAMRLYAIDMYDHLSPGEKDAIGNDMIKAGLITGIPASKTQLAGYVTLTFLSFSLAWSDSINDKYISKGVNDMVLHIPFFPAQDLALGSEAHKHYVELVRDSGLFETAMLEQNPNRFFLASPCKADLRVTKAMRACAKIGENTGMPAADDKRHWEYYTGGSSEQIEMSGFVLEEGDVEPTAGGVVSADYKGVKYCNSITWSKDLFFKPNTHSSIPAIQIDPVLMKGEDPNFCYSGSHLWQDSVSGIVTIISVAVSIGTSGVGAVIAGPIAVVINHKIKNTEYWPNH